MIKLNSINKIEALRYMGYANGTPDNSIMALVDECETELLKAIKARYVYNIFDINIYDDCISVNNTAVTLYGHDIVEHLKGCNKAILLCATLSSDVDRLIRMAQINNMTKALAYDSLASAAIEAVCNEVEIIIKKDYENNYFTYRFSPGYGDLPLNTQDSILTTLDTYKRIGLSLTDSCLMTPGKSVSAIIGISDTPIIRRKSGCINCNLNTTCNYRKRGTRCEY